MRLSERKTTSAVLRAELGWKLDADFCERAGCSLDLWRKLENGDRKLSAARATRLESAFGIDRSWLLAGNPKKPPVAVDGSRWSADYFAQYEARRLAGEGDVSFAVNVAGWLPALFAVAGAAARQGRLAELSVELDGFARLIRGRFGADDAAFGKAVERVQSAAEFDDWWTMDGFDGDLSGAMKRGATVNMTGYGHAPHPAHKAGGPVSAEGLRGLTVVRVGRKRRAKK